MWISVKRTVQTAGIKLWTLFLWVAQSHQTATSLTTAARTRAP